jgi:beta-glucosidase
VPLRAGETTTVTFPLESSVLQYWSIADHRFVLEKDDVEIRIGGSSDNLPLRAQIHVVP